jgi:hypothetical protein
MKNLKNVKIRIVLVVSALLFTSLAHASGPYVGRITRIETTYLPEFIAFSLSVPTGCAATANLIWSGGAGRPGNKENVKATYAGMLAAMLAGKTVNIWFSDSDPCAGAYLHVTVN